VSAAPSRPVENLLARLEGVRSQNGFYRAFCPAHDDRKTPNLDVKEGEDGRVLLLCRAGCSTDAHG
jgi:putative DNA primase/helicase